MVKPKFEKEEEHKRPDEDFAEESDESSDELKEEMDSGEREADVYSEAGREDLVEADELEPDEEGFMEGAEEKGELGHCATCHKVLDTDDKENVIERRIKGDIVWFCSENCAVNYGKGKKE